MGDMWIDWCIIQVANAKWRPYWFSSSTEKYDISLPVTPRFTERKFKNPKLVNLLTVDERERPVDFQLP